MLACLTLVSLHFFNDLYSHVLSFKIIFTLVLVCLGFCYSIQLYMCDCSIRVIAVLEYLKSASSLTSGIVLFYCAIIVIINTAKPIRGCGHRIQVNRWLRGVVSELDCY